MTRTLSVDVAVIGAGPAGSAAATVLARGGARVALADRASFPREKICGDGLLPDAAGALDALGVLPRLANVAWRSPYLRMRTASGQSVRLAVESLVLRRRDLDNILLERAQEAGAVLLTSHTLKGFGGSAGRWSAARFVAPSGEAEVEARAFVLATGAARAPRELAGLRGGHRPSAAALRGYARVTGLPADELLIALLGELPRGYAWAFPAAGGVWNVGCGAFAGSRERASLATVLRGFLASCGGEWIEAPHGAPLVTAFPQQPITRGNLAAVGEAAGLTRPFSGEGIGPSLDSGMLAARHLLASAGERGVAAYERELRRRFAADFRAWRFGEHFLRLPRLVDAIVRRAARYPGALRRCSGVLGGTLAASRVLSPFGLARLVLGR